MNRRDPASPLYHMVHEGQWDDLAALLARHLQIEVNAERFRACCLAFSCLNRSVLGLDWSDDTWRMWLKNRLDEAGAFTIGQASTAFCTLTVTLHIGFATVVETEEQLQRLAVSPAVERLLNLYDSWHDDEPRPARSKIGSTTRHIHPIDRVAARVAPPRHHD